MATLLIKLALLISSLVLMTGCSDLFGKKVSDSPISSRQFDAGCKLEIDDFKFILERDISPQIACLEKNIDLFMRVVESPKPGHLSRVAFEQYVVRNLPDFPAENVRAIKSVFEISHLILGEDKEYLSPSGVRKIFSFIRLVNVEMPRVHPFFKNKETTPFNLHDLQRIRIYGAADSISRALLDIFKADRGNEIHSINILELVESFTNSTPDAENTIAKVKAVLFVKKLILGGMKETLSHVELQDLLFKFAPVGSVVFDLVRVKYIDLTQKSLVELVASDLDVFERLLYHPADSGERLFSIDELIDAVPLFVDEETHFPDLSKYRAEILQAKMLIMSNARWSANEDLTGKEWILPGELRTLIGHGKEMARRGSIYHRIYEFFKPYLDSPGIVNINYNNYLLQFPTHEKYVREFSRISNQYRFFWGSFDMPYFSHSFRRNANGIVELGTLEHVLTMVARRYGQEIDGVGGFGMNLDQTINMVGLFSRILVDEGIFDEGREEKTTENIVLLSTLFQAQSNGDSFMSVDEGAAFFGQVLASMDHSKWFESEMGKRCATDDRGRTVDLDCHRNNYFEVLCLKFRDNFPNLLQAAGMSSCSDAGNVSWKKNYLIEVEKVARTCTVFNDNSDVPMSDSDYMPLMVMLMTIEGTILRYDVNKNNRMDANEVKTAYSQTFKSAIESMVEERASIIAKLPFNLGSAISRKFFYYLIKHRSLPTKFGHYLKLLTVRASPATRDTLAAVLNIISEQGAPSTYDCELLR